MWNSWWVESFHIELNFHYQRALNFNYREYDSKNHTQVQLYKLVKLISTSS